MFWLHLSETVVLSFAFLCPLMQLRASSFWKRTLCSQSPCWSISWMISSRRNTLQRLASGSSGFFVFNLDLMFKSQSFRFYNRREMIRKCYLGFHNLKFRWLITYHPSPRISQPLSFHNFSLHWLVLSYSYNRMHSCFCFPSIQD